MPLQWRVRELPGGRPRSPHSSKTQPRYFFVRALLRVYLSLLAGSVSLPPAPSCFLCCQSDVERPLPDLASHGPNTSVLATRSLALTGFAAREDTTKFGPDWRLWLAKTWRSLILTGFASRVKTRPPPPMRCLTTNPVPGSSAFLLTVSPSRLPFSRQTGQGHGEVEAVRVTIDNSVPFSVRRRFAFGSQR